MVQNILFLVVILLTNIVQYITGFAGTVLAMPFSIMLVGYPVAKPILNVVALIASFCVAEPAFRKINYKVLGKMCGGMLTGMAFGMFIKAHYSLTENQNFIYKTLGVLVIFFALLNAIKYFRKHEDKKLPLPVNILILFSAGLVHGMFVCGGPLLVTYASAQMPDKEEFHSTVSATWILLNGLIFLSDFREGAFTTPVIKLGATAIAVLVAAMIIGRIIYKKLSRDTFLKLTYLLMLISGVSLLLK